ncbi:MAG: DUF2617 family protein [Planctomycetota bacterium]
MDTPIRSNLLQSLQVVLYTRALHPEFFELRGRRVLRQGDYELEAWLMPTGHALRFEHGGKCVCELLTDQENGLPDLGVAEAFYCAGERDYDRAFTREGASYMTTVQTEQLSENLYAATHEELSDFAAEVEAVAHHWDDEGPCLSMLDMQRYHREVHVQSYHLVAQGGIVVRTQTIFEQS